MTKNVRRWHIHWFSLHHQRGANVYTECRCGRRGWYPLDGGYSAMDREWVERGKRTANAEREPRAVASRAPCSCSVCNKWSPHIDDASQDEILAEVAAGRLVRMPDNCSVWLCNDGGCPLDNLPNKEFI